MPGFQRVLVTGLGPLCSLGQERESFWSNIAAGRSFVGPVERLREAPVKVGAEIKHLQEASFLGAKDKRLDRSAQFAILASRAALLDAGLLEEKGMSPPPARDSGGVVIGSSRGPCLLLEAYHRSYLRNPRRVNPASSPITTPANLAGAVSRRFGLRGPSIVVSTACASGSHAIGLAFQMIRAGMADMMVAGGTEAALNPFTITMFDAAGILSPTAGAAPSPRPFDRDRDGTVIGEGAGMIVLESERHWMGRRGGRPYCELAGFGASSDAKSLAAVPSDGEGLSRAIRLALRDSDLAPREIGYVNAHGTGTITGDLAETKAIKTALGAHAYDAAVSSTKSMTGHLLGASGGIEAIVCVLALSRGLLPPTINLERPGEGCDLDYVAGRARPRSLKAAISSSMGFGGSNACLAFASWRA